jgi:hypothetical protein
MMDYAPIQKKGLPQADVLNALLSLHRSPSNLEVGVSRGETFHQVNAARKIAVDPTFRFSVPDYKPVNPNARYHEVESDVYFGRIARPGDSFDVIYLDGLHTLEQTLRDLLSSLSFLKDRDVIVIDDLYPSSHSASLPSQSDARIVRAKAGIKRKQWMGDVYRLVFFIDSFMQQLSYRTVEENHGQLVVWRKQRQWVTDVVLKEDVFRFEPFEAIRGEYAETMNLGLPNLQFGHLPCPRRFQAPL